MGIPPQRGRFFTAQDNEHSPLVVVVDDVFARKFFGDTNPIGKRIILNNFRAVRVPMGGNGAAEIIGVVGHVNQWGLDSDATQSLRAQLYMACQQMPDEFMPLVPSGISVMVRSSVVFSTVFDSIRRTAQQMSSDEVVYGAQSMEQIIADSIAARRFSMVLMGGFAGLALLLSSIGIYGVISYLVGQRAQEIGIRIALGAGRGEVLRMVLSHGGKMACIGVVIGLASSLGLTRLMAGMLYGVSPTDPLTFAGVAVILILVAFAACYIPARRATRVDPVVALRYQ
jgi:predicted permease